MKILGINRDLILGCASEGDLATLDLLFLDDPSLSILSPLARAGYFKARTGQIPPAVAVEATETIFAIPGEDSKALREGERIVSIVVEHVSHFIEKRFGGDGIFRICFESEGSICEYPGSYSMSLKELLALSPIKGGPFLPGAVLEALNSTVDRRRPECYPCDTDFIGVINYAIASVGQLRVDGFSATDAYNEFTICRDSFDLEGAEDSKFRWFDLLTEEQKTDLGIAEETGLDDQSVWIDRQQLLESYQDGFVMKCQFDSFVLCLGSGVSWRPDGIEDEWSTDLEGDSEGGAFHAQQVPILTYTYRSWSSQFDDPVPVLELVNAVLETVRNE